MSPNCAKLCSLSGLASYSNKDSNAPWTNGFLSKVRVSRFLTLVFCPHQGSLTLRNLFLGGVMTFLNGNQLCKQFEIVC